MSKYIIEYDEPSGQFYDKYNNPILAWAGAILEPYEPKDLEVGQEISAMPIDVISCIRAGMSADDIVKLRDAGIV